MNPQLLANLIQCYSVVLSSLDEIAKDKGLKKWADGQRAGIEEKQQYAKNQLRKTSGIDYDSKDAAAKIIKEGSVVTVLVDHMHGMKSGVANVLSYSLPAMLSDVTMKGGMVMDHHKWLTNDEVKLKSS